MALTKALAALNDDHARNWSPQLVHYDHNVPLRLPWQRQSTSASAMGRLAFQLIAEETMAYTPDRERQYDLDRVQTTHPATSIFRERRKRDAAQDPAPMFMFGRTADGASVCVRLLGFKKRVYILWDGRTDADADDFVETLCGLMRKAQEAGMHEKHAPIEPRDLLWEVVELSHLLHWDPTDEAVAAAAAWKPGEPPVKLPPRNHRYLELFLPDEQAVQLLQTVLAGRPGCRDADLVEAGVQARTTYPMYESDVTLATQLFARSGVRPGGWLSVPWDDTVPEDRFSHCDIEMDLTVPFEIDAQRQVPSDLLHFEERTGIAPLRVLSFDIETVAGTAPDHFRFAQSGRSEDEVVLITGTCDALGSTERPLRVAVTTMALDLTDKDMPKQALMQEREHLRASLTRQAAEGKPVVLDARTDFVVMPDVVIICRNESDLLAAWRAVRIVLDPDVRTGYNIYCYDDAFLNKRAELLGAGQPQNTHIYFYQSRLVHQRCFGRDRMLSSKAYGKNKQHVLQCAGSFAMDMLFYIKTNHKLRLYGLGATAELFLGLNKTDMPYATIHKIVRGRDARRGWDILMYGTADADLPLFEMLALKALAALMPMATVTKTPPNILCTRGQQVRTYNQLLVACTANRQVLDALYVPKDWDAEHAGTGAEDGDDEGYEGAIVLPMEVGYYTEPIATGDFEALYPSIMRTSNLCYSTHVQDERLMNLPGVRYHRVEIDEKTTEIWVHQDHHQGTVPQFLTSVLSERKNVKGDMKKFAKDSIEYGNLDCRQLALKVVANSTYGFTGASKGYLPKRQIASSTTALGRKHILRTKEIIHTQFQPENDPSYPRSRVIYGDTDSVMFVFPGLGPADLPRLWKHVEMVMASVTKQLRDGDPTSVLNIVTEAIATRALYVMQKKYAFWYQDGDGKPFQLKVRGLDVVRRDKPPVLCEIQRQVLDILMRDPVDSAVAHAEETLCEYLHKICTGTVPLDDYVMTKELRDDYKAEQPHSAVVAKQKAREPGSEIEVGQRVPFVYVEGGSKQKRCSKAEDVQWVRTHPDVCKLDRIWYFELIQRSLMGRDEDSWGLMTHISPDAATLLFAPYMHTLVRQRDRTSSVAALFGGKEPSILPSDVLETARATRERARAQAEDGNKHAKVPVISDARGRKASANKLPPGQTALMSALFATKRERERERAPELTSESSEPAPKVFKVDTTAAATPAKVAHAKNSLARLFSVTKQPPPAPPFV